MLDPFRIQSVADARDLARRRVPRMIFNFIDGGAGSESAAALGEAALDSTRLMPRVLVNVEHRSTNTRFLGHDYSLPFGIAPMGMAGLAWPDTDRFLAKAAKDHGLPVGVSTASSMTLEDYQHQSNGQAWFQLYFTGTVEGTVALAQRAADAGYEHLVFTVDTPVLSHRPREFRSGFVIPFKMRWQQFVDCAVHPRWSLTMLANGIPQLANFANSSFDRTAMRGALDLDLLNALRDAWKGKLIVKGVMAPADAITIRDAGVDAIWVSTHGGRQLDSAPAAAQMLPRVREALGADYPLVFDSGVRSGDDIIRALALGADFVMLGRPFLYAVAADGEAGLTRIITLLADDVSRTMAQLGVTSIDQLDASVIAS